MFWLKRCWFWVLTAGGVVGRVSGGMLVLRSEEDVHESKGLQGVVMKLLVGYNIAQRQSIKNMGGVGQLIHHFG